jgi:hypothetical protein
MALSFEERKALLAPTAAKRREVIRAAMDYMSRTGLSETDFARRLRTRGGSSYSRSTLNLFLNERYHHVSGNDSSICLAIQDFIANNPAQVRIKVTGKLYETENVRLIRDQFYQALDGGEARYFKGAPGSQKSFVLLHLIADLTCAEVSKNGHGRRAFYIYCREGITPKQLMKRVAEAVGSLGAGDTDRILKNIRFDIGTRKSLLVFDESQHLSVPCLETIRELHDMPPHCGLLFAGSHNIGEIFNRLDMEQWASRLRKGTELPGLSEDEAREIVLGELGKQPDAKVEGLIKKCYATDLRKGRDVKYISARNLFLSIQAIQKRQIAKGATE